MNFKRNCSSTSVHLIFCNINPLAVEKSLKPVFPVDPNHPILIISFPNNLSLPDFNPAHTFYNYRKANYKSLCLFFSSYD